MPAVAQAQPSKPAPHGLGAVAGYSSQTGSPARIAPNPNLSGSEGGLWVEGTVVADTPDQLIIQDHEGLHWGMPSSPSRMPGPRSRRLIPKTREVGLWVNREKP
ncbi:uncharacterized protein STAUR_7136 [Stigmatella aurantiaca DW4/3-1]|uniref:Uncharacterized protein n=1 Tax=Stigmatella aurantiaca (strain DW4/3-1) TaxID=378806 RepID=E3FZ75_STIAD|nr:uncharacterized protein STAUR_7136 [Stigmatella aurantiaca DW4/3-1]